MPVKNRNRKPITLRSDLHAIAKKNSKERGLKLEALSDEIYEAGIRVKRLLPNLTSESSPTNVQKSSE